MRKKKEHMGGILAVILGILILVVLFWVGTREPEPKPTVTNNTTVSVEANAVSAEQLQQRLDDIKAKEDAIEAARLAEIRRKEEAERRAREAKAKAEAEQKAKEEARRKAEAEKKAQEAKAKAEAEQKAKAEAEQKAKEEARRKAEAEKKAQEAKAKAEAAQKAKEEAAQKAKEEAAQKAKEEARKLSAIQSVEQLDGLSSYDENQALTDFSGQVQSKTRQYWKLPPNIPDNLSAKLLIKIDQSGNVVSVSIAQSSGYQLFDNAALEAVRNASPLPLPKNIKALQLIVREGLEFNFSP